MIVNTKRKQLTEENNIQQMKKELPDRQIFRRGVAQNYAKRTKRIWSYTPLTNTPHNRTATTIKRNMWVSVSEKKNFLLIFSFFSVALSVFYYVFLYCRHARTHRRQKRN